MAALTDTAGVDLARVGAALRRHLRAGILAGCACMLAATVTIALLPYSYAASALVLVKVGRNQAAAHSVGTQSTDQMVLTGVRAEDVASEIELLLSPLVAELAIETLGGSLPAATPGASSGLRAALRAGLAAVREAAEDVLAALNLRKRPTEHERLIGQLARGLRADRIARSDMIGVTLRWSSPEDAARILDAILDAYGRIRLEARRVFRGNEMFQNLADDAETRLGELASAIDEARRQAGIADAEMQVQAATQRIGTMDAELQVADIAATDAARQIELLRARMTDLAAAPPDREPLGADELTLGLRRRLADLRLEALREQQRLGERSEQARAAAEAVTALQSDLRRADLARIEREIEAQQLRLELLTTRRAALARERAEALAAVQQMRVAQLLISSLERRYAAADAAFRRLREQQEGAETLARLDIEGVSNVQVLGGARQLSAPAGPRKLMLLAAALVFSLFVAAATIIGLDWLGRGRAAPPAAAN